MTKIPAPPSTAHLALPFFDEAHRSLARDLLPWCAEQEIDERDDRAACREWVRRLGDGGWLRYAVPGSAGGALERLDSRALVLLRETGGRGAFLRLIDKRGGENRTTIPRRARSLL